MIRVVGLAGKRGSGKTTISSVLERQFGFARVSFGDFVRASATSRGLGHDVDTLEALGATLIRELGWTSLCSHVLAEAASLSGKIVIDGIRHTGARDAIRKLVAPGSFALVFVRVSDELRRSRLAERGRAGDDDAEREMGDELATLTRDADFSVDGAWPDAPDRIVAWTTT
jgi:cytidylate kinase